MTHPNLTIVAAVGLDGEIGRAGGLPWPRIAADMRRFRLLTAGGVVVMGRRTWNSLPFPLVGRTCIVVMNDGYVSPGTYHRYAGNLADAIWSHRDGPFLAVGGVEIFREALPLASTFHLTRVLARYPDADTYFPAWPFPAAGDGWRLIFTVSPKQAPGEPAIIMETYRK